MLLHIVILTALQRRQDPPRHSLLAPAGQAAHPGRGHDPQDCQGWLRERRPRGGLPVELAGGGHYNAAASARRSRRFRARFPPAWASLSTLRFPVPAMAGDVPGGSSYRGPLRRRRDLSTEKAAEIISGLKAAGIRHVSFKPGSVDGIRQVVNIAAANPDFPIIMQWARQRRRHCTAQAHTVPRRSNPSDSPLRRCRVRSVSSKVRYIGLSRPSTAEVVAIQYRRTHTKAPCRRHWSPRTCTS